MEYIIIGNVLLFFAIIFLFDKLSSKKRIKNTLKYKRDKEKEDKKYTYKVNNSLYTKKNRLLSRTEEKYYIILKKKFGKYLIFPQINLASIINKNARFRNELFRNIDFGIFNKNYELLLLIEINDKTHLKSNRIERDIKVTEILKGLNIKLLTFWTDTDKDKYKIIKQVKKEIKSVNTDLL